MSGHFKYKNKLFTSSTNFANGLDGRISILENNEYKITYYEIISGTSGTITPPAGATFNEGEFGSSGNAILSKITVDNKPSFETPLDAGNNPVTVSLNVSTGAYICSGTYTDTDVALIYSINIIAANYSNLNNFYIVETELLSEYAYSKIQEEGVDLTQRKILNFIGPAVTVTDDAINNRTDVTITATGGGGGVAEKLFNYYNFI